MDKYTNIVLSGGSSKGLCFIGVLQFLEENDMIKNIKEVTGCSIGAFSGLLFLLGYKSSDLKKIFLGYNLDKLKKIKISKFFENFGLDDGKKVEKFIKVFIKKKKMNENITLQEFYEKTGKSLVTVCTNVNTKKVEFVRKEEFPDIPVYMAVQMSMCLPFIYKPVNFNGNLYVDGGLTCNFPVRYYFSQETEQKIIGFCFQEKNKTEDVLGFESYLYNILKSSFNTIEHLEKETAKEKGFTIITIEVPIYTNFNLDISEDVKKELYKVGYDAVKNFFQDKL